MKKFLILVTLLSFVLLSLFVASCGGNTDTDTSSDKASSDTTSDTSSSSDTSTESDASTDDTLTPDEPEKPVVDPEVQAKVDELLASKHKLTYNEDGSFRVLIFADLHMDANGNWSAVTAVKERVKTLVDRVNPNLVIYTGDNTIKSATEEKLRANIDVIAGYLEEKKIPWCHVYGNHDHEEALSLAEQQAIYESYEYCISKDVGGITGTGNYVHAVYNADGTIGSAIYMLYSGAYSAYGFGFVQNDQIDWYKQTSELLQAYNGGKVVNGMMAFHIPLYENRLAYENRNNKEIVYEWDGQKNEDICSADLDTTFFETILERGDIKAIVTGHDHVNDYMYNYMGIKLANSPNISDLTYGNRYVQGSRVIDLNAKTVGTSIPTYVTYLIERLNPDDFDTLDTNISIEISKENIENPIVTNTNGGNASGIVKVSVTESGGANGSDAIKIVRSNENLFDITFQLTDKGKLGNNKYLVVWADFSQIEFSAACFGLTTEKSAAGPYRTGNSNCKSPFYYLADGETEWQELSHNDDGCFGSSGEGTQAMNGKKGYFAFPVEYFMENSNVLTSDSLITGVYFYGAVYANIKYIDKPFYFDDFKLVESYK